MSRSGSPRRNEIFRDVGSAPHEPDEEGFIDVTRIAFAPDAALLTDVVIPLEAVSNTRTARGRLAVAQLEAQLETAMPGCGANTAHIRVWPQFETPPGGGLKKVSRPVSMRSPPLSFWVSIGTTRNGRGP